ncbi:MAG TPA: MarR family winged helix-turn-helix transcriptional regulator [Thermoanaerobaculia bacterium]|nr:MarR family winged helix-turn-helix transcriptional regulator [Thermoanaerobaculia bacterium]
MQQPSPGSQLSAVGADPILRQDAAELHRVLSHLLRVFQFRDRDRICCHDISVTQCYALEGLVVDGGMTLNQLAARLYLDKSTTSRVVDALVAKGYAVRRPHPDDGRAVLVAATADGRRLHARVEGDLLAGVEGIAAQFDPDVRRAMAELLARLVQAGAERIDAGGGSCRMRCG